LLDPDEKNVMWAITWKTHSIELVRALCLELTLIEVVDSATKPIFRAGCSLAKLRRSIKSE
jgi:hypothetical protein